MKVQTSHGEVTLTAEMLRAGMVFESKWASPSGETTERFTITSALDDSVWVAKVGSTCLVGWKAFCERERPVFLGLDTRCARPEDVERLCCGAKAPPMMGAVYPRGAGLHCSLAIGDHDTHEDIATGTKWRAEKTPATKPGGACGKCGVALSPGPFSQAMFTAMVGDRLVSLPVCDPCVVVIGERSANWAIRDGRIVPKGAAVATWRPPSEAFNRATFRGMPFPDAAFWPDRLAELKEAFADGELYVPRAAIPAPGEDAPKSPAAVAPEAQGPAAWVEDGGSIVDHEIVRVLGRREGAGDYTVRFSASLAPATAAALQSLAQAAARAAERAELAARDAAVAKACADVPAGCDAKGWANVVRVIAADCVERHNDAVRRRSGYECMHLDAIAKDAALYRPTIAVYVRERRAGYGREVAAERVPNTDLGGRLFRRLFAAYEAGR